MMLSQHRAHLSVLVDAASVGVVDRAAGDGSAAGVAAARWVLDVLAAAPTFG